MDSIQLNQKNFIKSYWISLNPTMDSIQFVSRAICSRTSWLVSIPLWIQFNSSDIDPDTKKPVESQSHYGFNSILNENSVVVRGYIGLNPTMDSIQFPTTYYSASYSFPSQSHYGFNSITQ